MFQRLAQLRKKHRQVQRNMRLRRNARRRDEDGFILLESIVSIGLITVLMTALTAFFITSTQTTNHLRIRQEAIQLADSAIEKVRSYSPAALITGRDTSSVSSIFTAGTSATAPVVLKNALATMTPIYDATAIVNAGAVKPVPAVNVAPVCPADLTTSTAYLPTTPVCQTVGTRNFSTTYYLGNCYLAIAGNASCGTAVPTTPYVTYLRAVVAVQWTTPCTNSSCIYVTSTLLNADQNPVLPSKILAASSFSVGTPDQLSYIGDIVPPVPSSMTLTGGINPVSWAAVGLPTGLSMSPAGAISGTIADPGASFTVVNFPATVSVWDAFVQKASGGTFTWTVWRNPSISSYVKNTTVGVPTTLDVRTFSTCPRSPCTYSLATSVAGTPGAGLTIDPTTGIISGTSNIVGQSTLAVTITDASGQAAHSATASVTWNVLYAATVCVPQISLNNGSFEAPVASAGAPNWETGGSSPLLWDTTEPDNIVELWKNDGTGPQASVTAQNANGGQPITAEDGSQWAELNANQTGALFQDIGTVPGQVLQWSVWHRGRYSTAANAATKKDIMQVQIGTTTQQVAQVPTGQTSVDIADGPSAWNLYRGIYVVPSGQTTTRFQFAAVSTASGDNSIGNFIDNLSLNNYVACLPNLPGDQLSTVSNPISSLQLLATRGSGNFSWGGGETLPAGLTMSSNGLITGTPTAVGTTHVVLTLTDTQTTFVQSIVFDWVVVPQPTVAPPATQRNTSGSAVSLQLVTSCQNTPCSYAMNNGPAGLSISNTGLITGTVNSGAQTFGSATVTVRDKQGVTATTAPFSWVVTATQSVTTPANQFSSVGTTVSLATTSTCPASPCGYSLSNAPIGLSISNTGRITGTIAAAAGSYNGVTVNVTDVNGFTVSSGTFSWTVNPAPLLTSPGNQRTARGGAVNLSMAALASGGTGAYAYSATGLPAWLSINASSGAITGTAPAGADSTTSPITVKLTDATGASSTTASFSWTVSNTLALTFPSQTAYMSTAVALDLDNFTRGGTGTYTYTATGLPSWLTLNGSNGQLTGTAPAVATNSTTKTSNITITARDSAGTTSVVTGINWYVTDLKWISPSSVSTPVGTVVSGTNAASYVSGGSGTRTYTASQLPTGLSVNTAGVLSGTVSTRGTWVIQLSTTDGVGATATATLTWTVT